MYGLIKNNKYESSKAVIQGFVRRHRKGKVYPGIIKMENSKVEGLVHFDIKEEDVAILHNFEGDEYEPIQVKAVTEKGEVDAIAYLHKNPADLEDFDWKQEEFVNNHKNVFANDHN